MPPKNDAAFGKNTPEYNRLREMFLRGELSENAEPADVRHEFPSLDGKPTTQFNNGFNRCRRECIELKSVFASKKMLNLYFFIIILLSFGYLHSFFFIKYLIFFFKKVQKKWCDEDGGTIGLGKVVEGTQVVPTDVLKNSTIVSVGTTSKGVFKGQGVKLSTVEQEHEVCALNPLRSTVKNVRNGFVAAASATIGTMAEEKEVQVEDCKNCTINGFIPMYMVHRFRDQAMLEHCLVIINLPSGVAAGGLEGKLSSTVSSCGTKLIIQCEWPQSLSDVDALKAAIKDDVIHKEGRRVGSETMHGIVSAFKLELQRIREQIGFKESQCLGATTVIELPFEVDSIPWLSTTSCDSTTESYTVYIILRKHTKAKDKNACNLRIKYAPVKRQKLHLHSPERTYARSSTPMTYGSPSSDVSDD